MLSEAKDTSELMVDLAYAALYFGDADMAEEVGELEERMSDLVHDMRAICVLAARSKQEAEEMASVLQVISAIENIGNDAVDIARIVTHRLGIPRELVADLSNAEEVSHRVRVRENSHLARRPLSALELPVQTGMRVVAIRRDRDWITDVDGDIVCVPGDVLFLRGSPSGIDRLRELAAAPAWTPPVPPEDGTLSDLDRAVDVLVEMKNISEAAIGLAYSALVLRDQGLAAEVRHLEDRLDEMKDRLELWVLRAAADNLDPSPLRGLLHLSQAAEDLGDQAQQLDVEPGFHVLAVRRDQRYLYRPRGHVRLLPGDELIASGPDEGHPDLAELCGWRLVEDDETGEQELVPLRPVEAR
jgi:uncharacterized protein with PhoU and TrkA domain